MDERDQQRRDNRGNFFFAQQCRVCGRRLRVPVDLIGREINCRHCGSNLIASVNDNRSRRSGDSLLETVNRLLDLA